MFLWPLRGPTLLLCMAGKAIAAKHHFLQHCHERGCWDASMGQGHPWTHIFWTGKNSHLHWDHLVVENASPSMLDRRCRCVDVSSSAHPPQYPAMPRGTKILESALLMDLKPSTISCNSRMLSEARRFQKLPGFSWDKWAVGRIYRHCCWRAMPILVTSMYKL